MGASSKTILLVDDDALVAHDEIALLQRGGYRVLHSRNGEEAIEAARSAPKGIDLILMDLDLGGGIDGAEAAREILKSKALPLLFLSSPTEPEIVERTEGIANYGYVVKPTTLCMLDASIKTALSLFDERKQVDRRGEEAERERFGQRGRHDSSPSAPSMTETRILERTLRNSEIRYRGLLNAIGEGFVFLNERRECVLANPSAEMMFGTPPGGMIGLTPFAFIDPGMESLIEKEAQKREKGESSVYAVQIISMDGHRRLLRISASPVTEEGRFIGSSVIFTDITEQRKNEEELRISAERQSVLMKELEHRVKNSLAIVSSLLGISMSAVTDRKARSILVDTQRKIESMSDIYYRLCLSESVEAIDFGTYVEGLSSSLLDTYSAPSTKIKLSLEVEHIEIDLKRAMALGLILNELLTNAIKYAFPRKRLGKIKVALDSSYEEIRLVVSDDGIGLPDADILLSSPSIGMTLIRMLATQIDGRVEIDSSIGTSISVTFPR